MACLLPPNVQRRTSFYHETTAFIPRAIDKKEIDVAGDGNRGIASVNRSIYDVPSTLP